MQFLRRWLGIDRIEENIERINLRHEEIQCFLHQIERKLKGIEGMSNFDIEEGLSG